MVSLVKKVGVELLVKAVAETILVVGFFIAGTFGGTKWLTSVFESLGAYRAWFWVGGVLVAVVAGVAFFRHRLGKGVPRFQKIDSDVILEKLEIRYQWISPREIIYSRHYRLRALKEIDRYTDKFRWSANGKLKMRSTVVGHEIVRPPPTALYDFFDIRFEKHYGKGAIINTGVIWELDDTNCTSRPFISRTIHEPTEELTLTVEVPPEWRIENVVVEVAPDAGAPHNIEAKAWPMSNGKASWPPPKPIKLLHHYQLRWQWPSNLNEHSQLNSTQTGGVPQQQIVAKTKL
jgi:hypothetical protein